jgi:hypothetical protein
LFQGHIRLAGVRKKEGDRVGLPACIPYDECSLGFFVAWEAVVAAGSSFPWEQSRVARWFRFVEKKRGQRRTGSPLVGVAGEVAFCGALFFVGTLLLSVLITAQLVDPDPAQLSLGVGWWLLVLLGVSTCVLGGGGLIWVVVRVGTSQERRSALARRAAEIELLAQTVPWPREYPTLPPLEGLTNSPGTILAYRLPPAQSPGWQLLAAALFAMLWNAVVCLLTVSVIRGHLAGRPAWVWTLLLVPFWGVGFWSIRALLRLVLLHSGAGRTTVEISDLPLVPGQTYELVVCQHGPGTLQRLQIWLVCEEEATFTQGTDIRIERRAVWRDLVWEGRDLVLEAHTPWVQHCRLKVPPLAMHSFQSEHNAIRWSVVVCGQPPRWPAFERGFPVVVYPGPATKQAATGPSASRAGREWADPSLIAGLRA